MYSKLFYFLDVYLVVLSVHMTASVHWPKISHVGDLNSSYLLPIFSSSSFTPSGGRRLQFHIQRGDSCWCWKLSQYSLLCYLLLELMGKMSQNKGTKSLYILTYQASPRNISTKSLQTPGLYLSVLSELLPIQEEKNTEMRRAENNKCER